MKYHLNRHVLVWLLLIGLVSHPSSANPEFFVPEDRSLSRKDYVDLGVPDPTESRNLEQYRSALNVLEKLPRTKLPRFSSPKSALVFERLLISDSRQIGLVLNEAKFDDLKSPDAIVAHFRGVRRLASLYKPSSRDGYVFDREVVEIHAYALQQGMKELSSRAAMREEVNEVADRIQKSESKEHRAKLSLLIRGTEDVMERASEVTSQLLSNLLILGSLDFVGQDAHEALIQHIERLVPRSRDYLSDRDAEFKVTMLRALARLDRNVRFKDKYLQIADSLDHSGESR